MVLATCASTSPHVSLGAASPPPATSCSKSRRAVAAAEAPLLAEVVLLAPADVPLADEFLLGGQNAIRYAPDAAGSTAASP
eukprot:CAMPEP_0172026382 /NCGR_PEP_ID=MMETSP1041-20130122/16416_1 /TAXON_ID=464988 /ORGANISM="Hemiselmis andersenii, Strain CCMP439" /LENGTH=80 /DNA_ID=CAMNT_0012682171 /DNA_START=44 /DNA_END=283 /DNA_ORIENTATION=+